VAANVSRRDLWLAVALVALTLIAYYPAIRGGFIWDDDRYVTDNALLRSVDGLGKIWFKPGATIQYYPLVFTTFWIERHLWGLAPAGYHVVNVVLHAASAFLVYLIMRGLAVRGAVVVALLFALHPVHVESVAWITERKNVLSGLFYLAAAFVYLRANGWLTSADARPSPRAYAATLALFACALLSKTVTATLPAALLLVIWRFRPVLADARDRRGGRRDNGMARAHERRRGRSRLGALVR
jgi:hypothetical protein